MNINKLCKELLVETYGEDLDTEDRVISTVHVDDEGYETSVLASDFEEKVVKVLKDGKRNFTRHDYDCDRCGGNSTTVFSNGRLSLWVSECDLKGCRNGYIGGYEGMFELDRRMFDVLEKHFNPDQQAPTY